MSSAVYLLPMRQVPASLGFTCTVAPARPGRRAIQVRLLPRVLALASLEPVGYFGLRHADAAPLLEGVSNFCRSVVLRYAW